MGCGERTHVCVCVGCQSASADCFGGVKRGLAVARGECMAWCVIARTEAGRGSWGSRAQQREGGIEGAGGNRGIEESRGGPQIGGAPVQVREQGWEES